MSKTATPKISVVVPSFNQGQYIEDTLTSVLDQGYPDVELFVFDGGSKDNTVEILRKHDRHITFWVSEPDKGHADAINKGLRRATGQLLAFLNSDDFFLPNALHYMAQAYAAHPDAGLYTGNGLIVDRRKENPRRYMRDIGFTYESLLRGSCYLLQPSTFINRKAWDKIGEFDDTLRFAIDLDYWLRVAREFDVVLIDELLSAWRMHEEIRTASGGLERWTDLWRICRKHTKDQLTPGLLVELFTILQHPQISEQLGMDIRAMAQKCFRSAYEEMQRVLNLRDCIPVGKGILFRPTPPSGSQPAFRAYSPVGKTGGAATPPGAAVTEDADAPRAPAVIKHSGSRPRIDIVLQATGAHAWAVGGGWENAARKLGCHHRTFRPRAQWGETDVRQDDGLFDYLANPQADILLLAGFDWHSQMLHGEPRWQDRWLLARARKILYVQESTLNHEKLSGTKDMEQAFRRAATLVDAIIYTDLNDRPLMESVGKPSLFQPFGVDDELFVETLPFAQRRPRAFFRGKHLPFANQAGSYQDRRALIQFLLDQKALDLVAYQEKPVTPQDLVDDFNRYQVAVNFPSVFSNHPTRIYEAMACGCAVVTNRTGVEDIDRQFEHGRHLLYYTNRQELLDAVRELAAQPGKAAQIAREGARHVREHHALHRRLAQAIEWMDSSPQTAVAKAPSAVACSAKSAAKTTIVIDGVIFDLQRGHPHGISRVWSRLLEQLSKTPLAGQIVVLDRAGLAPAIPGIRRRPVPKYNFRCFEDDSLRVQSWCDQENAALFISTYHTYAENTPTVIMLHDMIPEFTGQDLSQPEWRAKDRAIRKAVGYFAVSQSTANDFRRFYPQYAERKVYLTPNAVGDDIRRASALEIRAFKEKHGISKPYFLLVGHRALYKNAMLFFRAFALLPNRGDFEVVCTGGAAGLEIAFRPLVGDIPCQVLRISDSELSAAYSGAVALVYPSRYEGFGLPILEAQKCECPVITCRNSSIPEVAGEAVYYVDESDTAAMKQALLDVQRQGMRERLIEAGRQNVGRFSWSKTAGAIEQATAELCALASGLPPQPNDPLDTIQRLMFVLTNGADDARQLGIQIRQVVRQYARLEQYDRERLGIAEAKTAAGLHHLLPRLRGQLPKLRHLDGCTAFVLGLEAQRRQDWHLAFRCYAHALQNVPENFSPLYPLRLGFRILRTATARGDAATVDMVTRQIVGPMRLALPEGADGAAEEEAVSRWDELARTMEFPVEPRPDAPPASATPGSAEAPLVSAIVSTYKSERFLRGCLEDLLAQTIAGQLEIVVVDSCSPQNERAIVEEFQKRCPNIVYIRSDKRETVCGAWNRAIKAARGKYITNANTDDRHRCDALEILARTLDEHPDITLAYADCLITEVENETFENTTATRKFQWLDFSARDLLLKGCFCGPQPMWRREVHDEHGYFDAEFVSAGDYEFWLKIARTRKFLHVREVLGLYLESPASVEHSNAEHGAWEVREAQRRYGPEIVPGFGIDSMPPRPPSAFVRTAPPRRTTTIVIPPCGLAGNLTEARDLLNKKQHRAAWESAIAAINVRPFHPEAHLLLAKIALAAGAGDAARQCAQRARQLAPDWRPVRKFLKGDLCGQTKPKWLTAPPVPPPASRLSVCLIVKNEEQFLGQCLQSVRGIAHQIVVLDTGSTDQTVEIAKRFNAEVHFFAWSDDFSAARNEALKHATGDWVLILDADEELLAEHQRTIQEEMQSAGVMGYRLPIIDQGLEQEGCSYVPRLFRNAPGLFFVGRVHEQIFSSLEVRAKEWGLENRLGHAALLHHGYRKEVVDSRGKAARNLRLLQLAVEELPGEPNLVMNLGLELIRSGQLEAGLEQYREALRLMSVLPSGQVVPELRETLLTQLTSHLLGARRFSEIVELWRQPFPQSSGLTASQHFMLGLAHMELKQPAAAAEQMRQCLAKRGQPALSPINKEILRAGPHHCLALCLAELEQKAGAEQAFRDALGQEAKSHPVRFDFAKFQFQHGRPIEALKLMNELVAESCRDVQAWLLGGQIALSQPEFLEFAQDWTGEAIKHFPNDSAILLQRAEALTLNQQAALALPLWTRAHFPNSARHLAALTLCEVLEGECRRHFTPHTEKLVSQEFLKWYRHLIKCKAHSLVNQVNEKLDDLRAILPAAAGVLSAAMKQAGAAMAV